MTRRKSAGAECAYYVVPQFSYGLLRRWAVKEACSKKEKATMRTAKRMADGPYPSRREASREALRLNRKWRL